MSEEKIKPCPFCGADANLRTGNARKRVFGIIPYAEVGCTKCPWAKVRQFAPQHPGLEVGYAVSIWNQRYEVKYGE